MDHKKIKAAKKEILRLKQSIENSQIERFEIKKTIEKLNEHYKELGAITSRAEDEIDILEVMIKKEENPELYKNRSDEET